VVYSGSVYIVAHPDDDLLFQSPDLLTEIEQNSTRCITTIFTTSGDAGLGANFARNREMGNRAAYSFMGNISDNWMASTIWLGGQPVLLEASASRPSIQHIWLRVPDGNFLGTGFNSTGCTGLSKLYSSASLVARGLIVRQPGLPAVTSIWTLNSLKEAMSDAIGAIDPDVVRTLDWTSTESKDHADHTATAKLVRDVIQEGYSKTPLVG
jgi:LmbE family N-acetylglucosaminyl deacetylase